jgi:Domain of unknown function (DUF4189)
MKNTMLSKLIMISTAAILTACGGGGDSGSSSTAAPTYGSIYVNSQLGGGISANYSSAALAAEAAKAYCVRSSSSANSAATCLLVLEFGQNMCGSIFRSVNNATTGIWGVASASTAAVAESNALAACRTKGGTNCTFGLSACNGSGTPSSNSTTTLGFSTTDPSHNDIEFPEILQTQ